MPQAVLRHSAAAVGFVLAISATVAEASPCDLAGVEHRVHVRDFGAVGDGKTDDGPAIREALKAALNGARPAAVEFDSGKTYRVTSFDDGYVLQIADADKVTVHGHGAELLLLPPNMVARIQNSSNISLCGLTVDYSPLPFTQGMVVATDDAAGTFDLQIEKGFDLPAPDAQRVTDNGAVWGFAMPYQDGGRFDRRVQIKTVHAAPGERRVRITLGNPADVRRLTPNVTRLAMAMPHMGQSGSPVFSVYESDRIHLETLRLYAVPKIAFHIADNRGPVTFVDFEQRIRPGTSRAMTGWRGVFNVRDNRAPVSWDRCRVEGAFDDAFNLTGIFQLVQEKVGSNTWRLADQSADESPAYKVGDRLQAIDVVPNRHLLGESKIVSVVREGPKSLVVGLSDQLPLKAPTDTCGLCASRIINLDAANAGSSIRNCTIRGGVRLRGHATLERSSIDGLLRITSDPTREGPLPAGTVVKDSELRGIVRIGSDRVGAAVSKRMQAEGASYDARWDRGERWAHGIVLQNNRINALINADGTSFSMIDNDVVVPARTVLRLSNSGPVRIRNLTMQGRAVDRPLSLIRIGPGMSERDIVVERGQR